MSEDQSSKGMDQSTFSIKKDLPQTRSGITYDSLIQMNKNYSQALSKLKNDAILSNSQLNISKSDITVLNDLLNENLDYMYILVKKPLFQVEFGNLYSISMSFLENLRDFNQKEILLYQKLQKLKFLEMKFQSLVKKGSDEDLDKAEEILFDIEEIQKEPLILRQISLINVASIILYKGMIRFYMDDIELAEKYAVDALDLLERKNLPEEEKEIKRIQKMSHILEFLAQIYDLKRDFKSANSCYEKAYYLNIGKYGLNHEKTNEYKRKKEKYENYINQEMQRMEEENNGSYQYNNQNYDINNNIPEDDELNYESNQNYNSNDFEKEKKNEYSNNNFENRKLISGNISNAKGTTDTFSFKIPITKQIEPLLISIYDLPQDNEQDRFDPNLFICNMYLNKKNVFKFLQIKKNQQNYQLYTDEALNLILEKIELENGQVFILDGILNSALIR
jgi:hypothetical protein